MKLLAALSLSLAVAAARGQCLQLEPLQTVEDLGLNAIAAYMAIFDPDAAGPQPPQLYMSGNFSTAGGVWAPGLARWSGQTLSGVPGMPPNARGSMRSFDDGTGPALYIASLNALVPVIYRYTGATWNELPLPAAGYATHLHVFDPDGSGPLPVSLHAAIGGNGSMSRVFRYNAQGWTPVSDLFWEAGQLIPFDADGSGPQPPTLYRIVAWSHCPSPCGSGAEVYQLQPGGAWQMIASMSSNYAGTTIHASTVHDFDGPGGAPARLVVGGALDPAVFGGLKLAAWDGVSWKGVPDSPGFEVRTLTSFDPDGNAGPELPLLVAGSSADLYNGPPGAYSSLAAFDGSTWRTLGDFIGTTSVMRGDFDQDGAGPLKPSLVVSGLFTIAGNQLARNFAAFQDGRWKHVVPSPSGPIRSLEIFNDGGGQRLYAGGEFAWVGSAPANNIARWQGSHWQTLGAGVAAAQGPSRIRAMTAHHDGSGWALYVGGLFDSAGGVPASNIARWTGNTWEPVGAGITGGEVWALISHDPDGPGPLQAQLFAGGDFTQAGAHPAVGLARWNGTEWSGVSGFDQGIIRSFRSFNDGSGSALFMAGSGIRIAGLAENRAAKLADQSWIPLPPLGNENTVINTLAIHPHGGSYRVHALGSGIAAVLYPQFWFELPKPALEVFAARSFEDQQGHALFVGTSRLTARGWEWFGSINGPVYAISPLFDDGQGPSFFLGGLFSRTMQPSPVIARLRPCVDSCYANCDYSSWLPALNVSDFGCFLQKFAAGDPYANCDQSVTEPVLNIADFGCFLTRFAAGCQ